MKTGFLDLLFIALKKTILAALLLGSVNAAHAQINIHVSFDGTNTLMEVSGSLQNYSPDIIANAVDGSIAHNHFLFLQGGYGLQFGGWALTSGSAFPQANQFSASGQSIGFTGSYTVAPFNYRSGDLISASMTHLGDIFSLVALPGRSGTYSNSMNTATWSSDSAIPEPSSYALILGLGMMVMTVMRRRRSA